MATRAKGKKQKPGSKPMPPGTRSQHGGTRTRYFYGCRCKKCVKAESDYQRERKQRLKAEALAAKEE